MGKVILNALGDRKVRFVFPTQTSADSWAEALLRYGAVDAIEADRFLSLDMLIAAARERALPLDKTPADQALRLLWATGVLSGITKSNADSRVPAGEYPSLPELTALAKPDFPATKSQISFLARVAPYLRVFALRARSALEREAIGQISEETRDFLILNEDYDRFLVSHNAYEPLHYAPDFDHDDTQYFVFAPQLAFSYAHYAEILKSNEHFELITTKPPEPGHVPEPATDGPTLFHFGNFRQEFDWVFGTCKALIEQGTKPSGIAISVPVLSLRTKAYLDQAASSWSVPIEFRIGAKLSGYPFGQLLSALARTASEGLSLQSLRNLIGIGAFSWKQRSAAVDLIHFGEQYAIPESSSDRNYMSKLWLSTFSPSISHNAKESNEAFRFYSELKKSCDAILAAKNFLLVRTTIFDFRQRFLDESALPSSVAASLERTLDELDRLVEYEARLKLQTANAFATFLSLLDMVVYNPPDSNLDKVSVFSYQTGVLTASELHFVLECSQDSVQGFTTWLNDFPQEVFKKEELAAISDALVMESFDINHAIFCHANEGLSGFSVPNAWFAQVKAHEIDLTAAEDTGLSPEDLEEAAWFSGKASLIPQALPWYIKNAALGLFDESESYLIPRLMQGTVPQETHLVTPAASDTSVEATATPSRLIELLAKLPRAFSQGKAIFNPDRLSFYADCPFKWLVSVLPGLVVQASNATELAEGSMTHNAIARLFSEVQARDGRFIPTRLSDYDAIIDKALEQALAQTIKNSGPALEIALRSSFSRIKNRLQSLLTFEVSFEEEGWSIGDFEVPLHLDDETAGAVLEGRADRIAQRHVGDGHTFALIDFKKKNTPKKADFYLDDEGKLEDLQLAAYTEILASQGEIVETAFYWSVESTKPVCVFSTTQKWLTARETKRYRTKKPEEFARERKAVRNMLEKAAQSIRNGEFMKICPSKHACDACQWKALCRVHFALEHL